MEQIPATRFPIAHFARSLPSHQRDRFALFAQCAGIDQVNAHIRECL